MNRFLIFMYFYCAHFFRCWVYPRDQIFMLIKVIYETLKLRYPWLFHSFDEIDVYEYKWYYVQNNLRSIIHDHTCLFSPFHKTNLSWVSNCSFITRCKNIVFIKHLFDISCIFWFFKVVWYFLHFIFIF